MNCLISRNGIGGGLGQPAEGKVKLPQEAASPEAEKMPRL